MIDQSILDSELYVPLSPLHYLPTPKLLYSVKLLHESNNWKEQQVSSLPQAHHINTTICHLKVLPHLPLGQIGGIMVPSILGEVMIGYHLPIHIHQVHLDNQGKNNGTMTGNPSPRPGGMSRVWRWIWGVMRHHHHNNNSNNSRLCRMRMRGRRIVKEDGLGRMRMKMRKVTRGVFIVRRNHLRGRVMLGRKQ
jgi:hypothetical protein